jgi:uncharacterized alkaline shock family protein YloU
VYAKLKRIEVGERIALLEKDNHTMNVFNRIFIILVSLIAIAFSIIVFLLVGGIIRPAQVSPGGFLLSFWSFFAQLNQANATSATVVCVVVLILAVILLILELIIFQREPAQFLLRNERLGKVTVARGSVSRLVGYESKNIEGVIETRQIVNEGRDGLRVRVRALLVPEADAPEVGHALQEKVQKSIQVHLGLPVAEVHVATQLEPFDTPRRRRVQ